MPTESQSINPYVGPRPFERQDAAKFFGREREVSGLLSLITAYPVVLFYGQSGTGKSSIINAVVCTELEKMGFQIFPVARVGGMSYPSDIQPSDIDNIYVFNVLLNWSAPNVDPISVGQMTLAEYLQSYERPLDALGQPVPRLIIFDQFEELFTYYPQHWKEREGFFKQIKFALEQDFRLRVVFALREDYLAQIDPYSRLLGDIEQKRFRLEGMRWEAALSAVAKPVVQANCIYAEGVAESLVEELMKVRVESEAGTPMEMVGEFAEPVQLQVVCQSLWDSLPPDTEIINANHLEQFGTLTQALSDFYERCIAEVVDKTDVKERELRHWFEAALITPVGTRALVFRDKEQTQGLPNSAVDLLENMHLVRGEWRAGARWYELPHDRLIAPIQAANRLWQDNFFFRRLPILRKK
jgi:hypothetical protein